MPNDCYNSLAIKASPEIIEKILAFVKSDENAFDFNKIIPMPDYIYDGDVGTEEEIYGKYNWYDWSCENWGTKWNAYDIKVYDDGFGFCTAWGPAHPVIERLAILFPEADFIYTGNEPGCCFCFAREYRKGILVYEMDGEYGEYYFCDMDDEEKENLFKNYGISHESPCFEEKIEFEKCFGKAKTGTIFAYESEDLYDECGMIKIYDGEFFDARCDEKPNYHCI